MSREDRLTVVMPAEFLEVSVSQLLDQVFGADEEKQRAISERFDLRTNLDLPDIYAVFLAVCEEWRDWRCALAVSCVGSPVELDEPVLRLLRLDEDKRNVALHLEQHYTPLEYAVRHGLWNSRDELLYWMRSMTVLYFLDKHEVEVATPGSSSGTASSLARAVEYLHSQGIVAQQQSEEGGSDEPGPMAITPEGRGFIARLLSETESYIDQYDHYQDTLFDADRNVVEFGTGRGLDLRVEALLAEELDPIRTVFLLRLYDGTLDARLRDWAAVLESDEFFDSVLEPVVNRDGVPLDAMEAVMEQGYAWLEEQHEQARRDAADRDLLRRAGGDVPC